MTVNWTAQLGDVITGFVINNQITMFINGNLVATFNDTALTTGYPGVMLYAEGAAANAEVTTFSCGNAQDVSTVSGNAGVAGATVAWSGTASGSTTADGSGNWSIDLPNGSYTITPSLAGYTFSPTSASETVSGSNITGVNFTATQTQVATPTFSPVAGTYTSVQTVTVSSTDSGLAGFAMYYTTDGTTPTTGSTLYTTPISVGTSETIKVLAVATSYANSNVGSAAYVINLTPSVYSVPDCRVAPYGPNASRTVQGTVTYDVQTSSNPNVPPVDSRAAGAPVDSRAAGQAPQNCRNTPSE